MGTVMDGMMAETTNKFFPAGIRLGLCCIFRNEPIRFHGTTAKYLKKFPRAEQLVKLSTFCLQNCTSLLTALRFVHNKGIGAFRILSPFFPRFTHPDVGYTIEELPEHRKILHALSQVKQYRDRYGLRLSFHPDQFIILSSPQLHVVENSIKELEYQGLLAEYIGAETINIHGGGKYDDKDLALRRIMKNFHRLSPRVTGRLTLENDDRIYSVRDLIPICERLGIPLVYDVHHHRCNPDGLSVEEATMLVLQTWSRVGREPYFHLSSPRNGWQASRPEPHADYIDPADFPECWKSLRITVDIEAKAKELAVLALKKTLMI
jgi:UV DNA damage endonuclease